MTKMAAIAINSKTFKTISSQKQKSYDFETKFEASGNRVTVYKVGIHHNAGMTLTYFMARST